MAASNPAVKIAVGVGGGLLTLAGLALMPLPGPGIFVVAGGLALLASQFSWAKKPLQYAQSKGEEGLQQLARRRLYAAFAVFCAMVVLGLGIVEFTRIDLPLINAWTAPMLVLSGLVLIGLVVYARHKARRASG